MSSEPDDDCAEESQQDQEVGTLSDLVSRLRKENTELRRSLSDDGAALALKASNMALKRARDRALLASRAKSVFLANVSHELRTPLNAIIGYTELIGEEIEEASPAEVRDDLEHIRSSADHLMLIIDDLLDLSRMEAGETEMDVKLFTLQEVMTEVCETMNPVIKTNANAFTVMVDGQLPTMETDARKVRQIIFNLLSNAAKFTKDGAVSVRALSTNYLGEPAVAISVRDTGMGIPDTAVAHLFTPFFQMSRQLDGGSAGTGLGLTICRKFAQLLGGDLQVETELGVGSVFTVTIPIRYVESESV